jgi:hypothetical protein
MSSKFKSRSPFLLARTFACLGEIDSTLHWLEVSYRQRAYPLHNINVPHQDCFDDSIRSDPRFIDLLKRMNLPEFDG